MQTEIYEADPTTYGAMLVPIILGSDKTTVSVATGNVEYHPAYISIGNILNRARRAHRNAVMPFAFLAIPKCMLAVLARVILILIAHSGSQIRQRCPVLQLQAQALSCIAGCNSPFTQARNDCASGAALS